MDNQIGNKKKRREGRRRKEEEVKAEGFYAQTRFQASRMLKTIEQQKRGRGLNELKENRKERKELKERKKNRRKGQLPGEGG